MKQESYLSKIRFDQTLLKTWIASFLRNPRLFSLIVLTVIIAGVYSFIDLPRRLNPEINIPIVIVSTVLPGASPVDMESLVTVPLEKSLTDVEDVTTQSSSSQANVSVITLEFASSVDPDKARSDVQSAVDTVNLPVDANAPRVAQLNFENQPVWSFVLSTDDEASLMRYANTLKDQLENGDTIKEVTTPGIDEQEIQIIINPEQIATYGVSPQVISQSITSSLSTYPAGLVQTQSNVFQLTIDPEVSTLEDLRSLIISVGGTPVPLSEVATVIETSKPNQNLSYIVNPDSPTRPAVRFDVFKTDNADITDAADEAEEIVQNSLENVSESFRIATIYNTSDDITDQFNDLVRDFWIIIVLIFIALFLFLGLRQAVVAAISVPFTFLISFTVMNIAGISINFLSLFSLLLSLGLLVDDTIVVISAMTAYHRTGKFLPLHTALMVWRDFIVAIFTTTITTVWAFLPLLLASGIIGEFIKSIPIVVSATLLASFFVAIFITMPFIIILLKPQLPRRVILLFQILSILILLGIFFAIVPKGPVLIIEILGLLLFLFVTVTVRRQLIDSTKKRYKLEKRRHQSIRNLPYYVNHGVVSFEPISNYYKKLITNILVRKQNRKSAIAMVLIFSVFSYLLLPLGFVKNEFFPSTDYDFVYVNLELPSGTNNTVTKQEASKILTLLKDTPHTEFVTADIGQGYSDTGGTTGGASNQVLFTIKFLPEHDRPVSSIKIAQDLREELSSYQKGKVSVIEISGGPPAGADLQIKLFGDDLTTLEQYAQNIEDHLATQPGVTNIDRSIKPGTSKVVFNPDEVQLALLGMTKEQFAYWLRIYASGIQSDTITLTEGGEELDITVRLTNNTPSVETLSSIYIPTPQGPVNLSSVGDFTLENNPTLITREDGKRTISVTAKVLEGYNIAEVNTELQTYADTNLDLPTGYSWSTGGVNEENERSVQSILQAMALSFLLIIVTMVLQFGSFRKALIVMLVIPLSISGVFIIFAITNTPLSFPALIGVLALFGIVVKNSILVVDKIKQNIDVGMDYINAIADGSSSRLEAISLTTVTAILGLIPITLSDPLWQGLGGAIIAGLTFSGTIMLFFIPIVYFYWFRPANYKDEAYGKKRRAGAKSTPTKRT